jgi:protein-S-isoprenylcysteine O-methyltransferase Ste14
MESQRRISAVERRAWRGIGPWAVIFFYLAIAFEVIVMITPFTVYFYSVYAPVLNRLEASPWTAWLTAFFLPHISYTGDRLLTALAYLGPILFGLGMAVFFVCAYQVYSAKLLRRGVVCGGLYAWIRHPQYLGLGIAGLGLLLYWPRFIILILYLTMLFVYHLLARDEERRMERKFGEAYREYKAEIPMFLPGGSGGRIFSLITRGSDRKGWALAGLYALVLALGVGAAFGLRSYSKARIPTVAEKGVLAVSLSGLEKNRLRKLLSASLEAPDVKRLMDKYHSKPGHTLVAYVLPQDYMMAHLIADIGEHESHHGKNEGGGALAALKHLGEMYALKPFRQLRDANYEGKRHAIVTKTTTSNKKLCDCDADAVPMRVIFTEASTAGGRVVPALMAFDADVLRYPLFLVELKGTQVALAMELPRRHAWGNIPVPAF